MSLRTSDFDYPLPEELIATRPLPRREDSRMLVLHRKLGTWEHRFFRDLPEYLRPEDLAVLNNTRVIPARLFSDDGRMELLLLEQIEDTAWRCLVRPGRKLRTGAHLHVAGVQGTVEQVFPDGDRLLRFERELDLERVGQIPLPPYMERPADQSDWERYQTVYAQQPGSVAAPTAGLHFCADMLKQVPHAFVTLHVGAGTFRPVQQEDPLLHPMHSERFLLPEPTALALKHATASGGRILAVGTTSARVLESCALSGMPLQAGEGRTNLFILPPYSFRIVDLLLTNFHLPKSTLLMLVSALAGRELVLAAYAEAIRNRYRFYSYGDCMLVL